MRQHLILLLVSCAAASFDVRLLADIDDVSVDYGLVKHHANTIERDTTYAPPPGNYTSGTMIVAMFRSLETDGAYEVYVTNSTGNIPLVTGSGMCLFRWTTLDFRSYSGGDCTLWLSSDGLGDVKTITRDDETGTYFMMVWGAPAPGANGGSPYLYTSTDSGQSWAGPYLTTNLDHYNPPGTTIHAKDDINLLYQPGVGLVDLQLFWQQNATIPGGDNVYCDNGGCDKRRVLGSMVSYGGSGGAGAGGGGGSEPGSGLGLVWNYTGQVRIPGVEPDDPPELQFYRSRPFLVPGTRGRRVFAHTLLYAPSPWINFEYGRQPPEGGGACSDPPKDPHWCHGPHMYEEWWTLRSGASAADMSPRAWRRPARLTKMAPENAYLFAQPGLVERAGAMKMIWVGSGEVYTLPLHRAVGLYAPANARVRVPAFDLRAANASTKMMLNADAKWGPKLPQGGCDETCAAYVLVELEDEHGQVIPGYDRASFNPIMDQDGIDLPLRWNNATQLPVGRANVTAKIWFRAARVYAVYVGQSFDPGF
eukprot:g1361.t1